MTRKWSNKEIENYKITVSLDTWKNYNSGVSNLMDGIITLPIRDKKLDAFLKQNLKYEPEQNDELFALDYVDGDLFNLYGQTQYSCDIQLLNDFAKIWDACSVTEKQALVALNDIEENMDLKELCNAALQIHNNPEYPYYKYDFEGIDALDELGRTCEERMSENDMYGWQLEQKFKDSVDDTLTFDKMSYYMDWSRMAEEYEMNGNIYFDKYGYMDDRNYANYISLEKYDRNTIHGKANELFAQNEKKREKRKATKLPKTALGKQMMVKEGNVVEDNKDKKTREH